MLRPTGVYQPNGDLNVPPPKRTWALTPLCASGSRQSLYQLVWPLHLDPLLNFKIKLKYFKIKYLQFELTSKIQF